MSDQKSKWADKAAKYRDWAKKAQLQAEMIVAGHEKYKGDIAFWTQPYHIK